MVEQCDPLSVHINADSRQVWVMLREPANIAQWHDWQHPNLDEEIARTYFTSATEGPDHRWLRLSGGETIALAPVEDGTAVSLEPATGSDPDAVQRWVTNLQQLRFALERHPNAVRRTGYFTGAAPDGVAIADKLGCSALPGPGEDYSLDSPTGVRLEGRVWFRTDRQIGLTVDSYAEHGDGLLILIDRPSRPENPGQPGTSAAGAAVHASMYGLGAARLRAVWDRWEAFRARHYPDSPPLVFPELVRH